MAREYLVKIKRDTIVKNPDVGQRSFLVKGKDSIQRVYSIVPAPKYYYDYEDTKIVCCHCKRIVKRSELLDEDDYDYDGNYFGLSNICPKCRREDCCSLTFEKIEEVNHE